MKFDETIAKLNQEEKAKVLELLRGKADMEKKLLLSDCELAIKQTVDEYRGAELTKAMYIICDAITGNYRRDKGGKYSHVKTVRADLQEEYHMIANEFIGIITKHIGKK